MTNYDPNNFSGPRMPMPDGGPLTGLTPPSGTMPSGKKGRAAKSHRTKNAPNSLGLQRKLFAVAAVLAALVAVLFVTRSEPITYVIRTNTQIPALSPISAAQLNADPIDPKSVEPGTLSGTDAKKLIEEATALIEGKRTLTALSEQQQLRSEFLGTLPELTADERLVSISAQAARAVGGTLNVGDLLDVYVTTTDGRSALLDSKVEIVAVTVSQNQLDAASQAQVEDRTKSIGDLLPARPIPGTYILRVKVDRVASYVAGDAAGSLALVLRPANAGDTPSGGVSIPSLVDTATSGVQTCQPGQEGCVNP
jgi:Flp pilus assembly protein CpaB